VVISLDAVAARSQNQRGVRTILLAAAALPLLTGCQSAVEKQRLAAEAQSGDDDTDFAITEGGQLFVGCGSGDTSFTVVGCEVLKGEAENVISDS
jgi:hypothetical protein